MRCVEEKRPCPARWQPTEKRRPGLELTDAGKAATRRRPGCRRPLTDKRFAVLRQHTAEPIWLRADALEDELGKRSFQARVLYVMQRVPRHLSVVPELAASGNQDSPLPSGFKWTGFAHLNAYAAIGYAGA